MAETNLYSVVEYEDGLQVIPNNWLSTDLKKAFWPRYTNNKLYDRAVKEMEEPKSTWLEFPVQKIFGTFSCYEKARKKLKDAEDFSDINSATEVEGYLKTSRKFRAAKIISDSTNSSDEMDDFVKDMPKIPNKKQTTHSSDITKGNANVIGAKGQRKINKNELIEENIQPCSKKMINKDSPLQHCKSVSRPMSNVMHNLKHNFKEHVQEAQDEFLFHACDMQTLNQNENSNEKLPTTSKQGPADLYVESENFHRFVIGRLINIEMKINIIETNQKLILQKLSITDNMYSEENDDIDIFQDLPLKTVQELEAVETKLRNDSKYRKRMIKDLARVVCKDIKTSSIRLMRQIFSNELAMKYSWQGAKKKEIFSDLQLCKTIMRVVRNSHPNTTDELISGPIKVWLAHAKERAQKLNNN